MVGNRVGTQFGPYRLDELLGRGGMGEVYRAYDTVKDRTVALKLLNPGLADDSTYQERFRRESRAVARLGEPHVIPIHDWGEIDGVLFIDMRLVHGEDLRALLTRETKLDPERSVSIIEQVAAALDAAHGEGLVHRDVKPENILVDTNDFAYLVDFGVAHADEDTHLTQTGTAVGSLAYMAPELFDATPLTPASDIYALACVLFECLTGRVPHPATTVSSAIKAALLEPPPAPSTVTAGVPAAMDEVIRHGLAADPAQRFSSAAELARAARAALTGEPAPRSYSAVNLSKAPSTVIAPPDPAYDQTQVRQTGPESVVGTNHSGAQQVSDHHGFPGTRRVTDSQPYPTGQQFSGPQPYPAAYAPPAAYPPAYPPAERRRSPAIPILIGLIVVALIGLAVVAGVLLAGTGDDTSDTASEPTTPTVTETVVPPQTQNPQPAPPQPAVPSGSTPCDSTVGVGTSVTSCPFAFAVRDEYFRAGGARTARVIYAASPVTGLTYAMTCVPEGSVVTCRGGNDAVVHIY